MVPTSDCVHIERIPPESPEGLAVGKDLLATHHDLSQLKNPQLLEIRSIDLLGDFVLFQAIVEGFEPAIFVLQKTADGYQHIGSWGGQASSASEIRSALASELPQIPLELLACMEPAEWFLHSSR